MLPKNARLKSRFLFTRALNPQMGHPLGSSPFFKLLAVPHEDAYLEFLAASGRPFPTTRFGLIVSKKVDKRAVIRNRLKRRYRHILRNDILGQASLESLSRYRAIVLIVRQASVEASFKDLSLHLRKRLLINK